MGAETRLSPTNSTQPQQSDQARSMTPESNDTDNVEISAPVPHGSKQPQQRKRGKSSSKSRKRNFLIQSVIEIISLVAHGIHGVLAHVMVVIPSHPIKSVGFLAVLVVLALEEGIRHHESQEFCFRTSILLTVIALALIALLFRSPGNDERLREMQHARADAIKVNAFDYEGKSRDRK